MRSRSYYPDKLIGSNVSRHWPAELSLFPPIQRQQHTQTDTERSCYYHSCALCSCGKNWQIQSILRILAIIFSGLLHDMPFACYYSQKSSNHPLLRISLQEYTECSSDMFYLLQGKITQPHNTKYSDNNLWNYIICSFHLLSFIFISEDEVRI